MSSQEKNDIPAEPIDSSVSEQNKKIKFIGYGTFMTDSLSNMKKSSHQSTLWGMPITILDIVEVKDYRRISQPYSPFPYAIKEKGHSFLGLAFEIEEKYLSSLDHIEGLPYLYERHSVEIGGESYFIYIPSATTYQNHVRNYHRADLIDFWHFRVVQSMNTTAKNKFPQVLSWQV